MILAIDNYDSFTFTLVDYLLSLGAEVRVERNDAITVDQALASGAHGFLISPGPGKPEDAGISRRAFARMHRTEQATARRLPRPSGDRPWRAALRSSGSRRCTARSLQVRHDGSGLFADLPSPLAATRYHSLAVIDPQPPLLANAWSEDGLVMGMRHQSAPVHGVQFHPESIASEHGHALLGAFLRLCAETA